MFAPLVAAVALANVTLLPLGPRLGVEGTLTGSDPALQYSVSLTGGGQAATTCHLPNGKTVPGKVLSVARYGDVLLPIGQATFSLITDAVEADDLPTPAQAGCPPQTKSVTLGPTLWQQAFLFVFQGGEVVDVQSYPLQA